MTSYGSGTDFWNLGESLNRIRRFEGAVTQLKPSTNRRGSGTRLGTVAVRISPTTVFFARGLDVSGCAFTGSLLAGKPDD
jgi:hypothetical protein